MAEKEIKDYSFILTKLTWEKVTSLEVRESTDEQNTRGKSNGKS